MTKGALFVTISSQSCNGRLVVRAMDRAYRGHCFRRCRRLVVILCNGLTGKVTRSLHKRNKVQVYRSSSPAKAGDPVNTDLSGGTATFVFTGSPAFAGHDE